MTRSARFQPSVMICSVIGVAMMLVPCVALSQRNEPAKQQGKQRSRAGQVGRTIPAVSELFRRFDKDANGKLEKAEVRGYSYARNFDRWDTNGDGAVSTDELIAFRRKTGVPVAGTSGGADARADADRVPARLTIPEIQQLTRVDRTTRPSRDEARNSAYILRTAPHRVAGDQYVILTDHTESGYLEPLERLAKYHKGVVMRVENLTHVHAPKVMPVLRQRLRDANVRFLAIAPRLESFRENTLLGLWELLSTLDDDPQLDALPGVLLASHADEFAELIDRSIAYQPKTPEQVRPFAISQVPTSQELRSLQKSGMLRQLFKTHGLETPTAGVYTSRATDAPSLPGEQFWKLQLPRRGEFVRQFPPDVRDALGAASLWVMHGHGVPGMSCSIDIDALPDPLTAEIILCGSCFSAAPRQSDLPAMREAPGGYEVHARDAFTLRAVDNGATVAFGHMRLSSGFPHLFPVLESWMEGETVGEAYQELINGLIDQKSVGAGQFVVAPGASSRNVPQNVLLYVIIGDPALQPFRRFGSE